MLRELQEEVGKCISCGFCEAVCPTLPSADFNLWKGARGRVIMGSELLKNSSTGKKENLSDSFYSCLDCHACLYVCPAGVNAGKVSHLSRQLIVSEGMGGEENPFARMIVSVTEQKMNPLGTRKKAAKWARGMQFDAGSDKLLYTGNMYQLMSYTGKLNTTRKLLGKRLSAYMASAVSKHPSLSFMLAVRNDRKAGSVSSNSLRNIVRLLENSGVRVNYLGEEEPYPGTFLYDLGYTDKFGQYANRVTEIFRNAGVKKIITIDPHTYELLKYTYPKYVTGFDFEVIYYLDLIKGDGFRKSGESVAYHEPCHFVLRENRYEKPYEILSSLTEVRMARKSGTRNECCGGPDELLFPEISEKTGIRRHNDLVDTGADTIVTSCPICLANLNRGGKIKDIADFLVERMDGSA